MQTYHAVLQVGNLSPRNQQYLRTLIIEKICATGHKKQNLKYMYIKPSCLHRTALGGKAGVYLEINM